MRTTDRVTVTVPKRLLAKAKDDVAAGLAPSVSAWITEAMEDKAGGERLADVMADLLQESGGPMTDEERAWVDSVLSR
jgi:hypothetical protein